MFNSNGIAVRRFGRNACASLLLLVLPSCLPAQSQTSVPYGPPALMPLEELNENVLPSWLQFNGQYRTRTEESGNVKFTSKSDTYDLSELRLMMTIAPTKWLQFVGETQDARVFFNGDGPIHSLPPYQNTFDIRQAYVQVGDASEGWATAVFGRQMLSFGDERLVGPSDWANQGRTFDVARVDLFLPSFGVSLFASSVVLARDGVIDHHYEGNNFYGAYSTFKHAVPHARLDPFVFWRVTPANVKLAENAGKGALNEVTAGVYWKGTLPAQFDYDVTMARQEGSLGIYSIGSWAGHWKAGRQFGHGRFNAHPFAEALYASGTTNPAGHSWNTFDQLYPSAHDKTDFADQVGWKNMKEIRTGVEEKVWKSWKVKQTYEDFWLASAKDALYATSGAVVARSLAGVDGTHVGQEIDAIVEGSLNKAIDIGFGIGHFYTGEFLQKTTAGHDFNYPFFYTTYHFTKNPEL